MRRVYVPLCQLVVLQAVPVSELLIGQWVALALLLSSDGHPESPLHINTIVIVLINTSDKNTDKNTQNSSTSERSQRYRQTNSQLTGFCFDFVHLSEERHLSIHQTDNRTETNMSWLSLCVNFYYLHGYPLHALIIGACSPKNVAQSQSGNPSSGPSLLFFTDFTESPLASPNPSFLSLLSIWKHYNSSFIKKKDGKQQTQ